MTDVTVGKMESIEVWRLEQGLPRAGWKDYPKVLRSLYFPIVTFLVAALIIYLLGGRLPEWVTVLLVGSAAYPVTLVWSIVMAFVRRNKVRQYIQRSTP